MEIIDYCVWYKLIPESKKLNSLLDDIEKYKPKNIVIFGLEEWEIGDVFRYEFYIKKIEKILIKYNINITVLLGSADYDYYKTYKFLPKINTNIVLWPMFWLYNTHNFLNTNYKIINNIDKLFISLNNRPHLHRCKMMDTLYKNDLFKYGDISWMDVNSNYQFKYWHAEELILDDEYKITTNQFTVPNEYFTTLFNLIAETTTDVPFLTEKTMMAILLGKPFLILGSKNIHKVLLDHGFKLYDELFDYSFDSYDNVDDRIEMIVENIKNIKDSDYNILWYSVIEKTRYNRNLAYDIIKNKKFIPEFIKSLKQTNGNILSKYYFNNFI